MHDESSAMTWGHSVPVTHTNNGREMVKVRKEVGGGHTCDLPGPQMTAVEGCEHVRRRGGGESRRNTNTLPHLNCAKKQEEKIWQNRRRPQQKHLHCQICMGNTLL